MRKQIIDPSHKNSSTSAQKWLDLEALTQVHITSEEPANPIERALLPAMDNLDQANPGWIAQQAGKQTLRLSFDNPQRITLIHLLFHETQQARTQEFFLRYSTDNGVSYQEILRQQYTFSPPHTTTQVEDYRVQLEQVTTLELTIIPDISGGNAYASLAELKLA